MSDRFDVLERYAPMFEAPEPSFERFQRRRDRKRRNQRISAGVVGIAVFLLAVWVVTTGGPFDRSPEPAAPTGPVLRSDGEILWLNDDGIGDSELVAVDPVT